MRVDSKMRLTSVIGIVLVLGTLCLACNGQKKAAMDDIEKDSTEEVVNSPLKFIMQENYAGTDTVVTQVIQSQKSLSKFFAGVNKTRKPGIPVPQIDFSKNMVVLYCSGEQGSGANPKLRLSNETETELIIGMVNQKDEKEGSIATVSPFSIYTVPLTSKKIRLD